jgi:hypothetical protein
VTAEAGGRLVRSSRWAGLHPGDPVAVVGTRLRSAHFEFVAHVRHAASGEEWIEVVGGRSGDRKLRSFRPEQVFPPKQKGQAQPASLAEAPRLPLG